jgi:tetratricopeptide (TPR) repeat protein
MAQFAVAGEWYAKAIAVDPNRETAYRYWGDVLLKQGKMIESRDKFIEAYIREPYSRLTQASFVAWSNQNHIDLAHPEVNIPTSVSQQDGGNTTINLDPNLFKKEKDPATSAWMYYGLVRVSWPKTNFAKEYPQEKTYRHSLKEEAAALRAVIEAINNNKEVDPKKLDGSLQTLLQLEKDGLLEAFILMAMPDSGIARDFLAYRNTNIDKLRRYVVSYVLKEAK